MKNFYIIPLLCFFLLLFSCGERHEHKEIVVYEDELMDLQDEIAEVREIFYDMYSPVETQQLFKKINAVFDPSILNPAENVHRYNTSNKIAVNLGVYGADMSFCHMFGQTQEAINYLLTIYRLAENLGVSESFMLHAENAADILHNQDSLFDIASRIYLSADRQLKESDRPGAAALILTGGWIEAIHISSNFYNPDNPDRIIEEQILTQKYSLDRLIALLSSHQQNEIISKYLLMIKQLKPIYDRVDILFDQDDLSIDTERKIIESFRPEFIYEKNDIAEIINIVNSIRRDMVN